MAKTWIIGCWVNCIFAFFYSGSVYAQFTQLPVASPQPVIPSESSRTLEAKLTLPFWDDFSSGQISPEKWENRGLSNSFTVGINPPSLGVVLLDGVDERGNPYAANIRERGEGDQLISKPFDLTGLTAEQINSLYLSFFWQAGGRSEFPDADDFLELYFADPMGNWIKVWDMAGGDLSKREVFTQAIVRVPIEFIHDNFKFKFQNRGRLSGPFDGWIIDYIFLNSGRNPTNTFFEDRSISQLPSSPLGRYSAVPLFELQRNSAAYSQNIQSQFNNLSNRFRAMEYTIQLKNKSTGAVLKTLNLNTPFNPVPLARERRNFESNPMSPLVMNQQEEFDLETSIYLTTGDRFLINRIQQQDTTYFTNVNFRVNDTVRSIIPIRDFFAYDNNSLDYSAGINQRSGMLAVRYHVEETAFVKGISINFTNFAQVGRPVELMVWTDLNRNPVFAKELNIPSKENLNEFTYFDLDTFLQVEGIFYVGFRQFTNDFIHVGLDKSNDNGREVFFNVIGEWEQNQTVAGSLMIRPHLSIEQPTEAEVEAIAVGIKAYPNPVVDKLFLEGDLDEVHVYDTFGRKINIPVDTYEEGKILNFMGKNKGIYMIRAYKNQKTTSIRILVK